MILKKVFVYGVHRFDGTFKRVVEAGGIAYYLCPEREADVIIPEDDGIVAQAVFAAAEDVALDEVAVYAPCRGCRGDVADCQTCS
jgi:hypothetical protein